MALIDLTPDTSSFIAKDKKILIGGQWSDAASDARVNVVNPSDGSVLGAFGDASAEDVDRAVAAARKAFEEGPWGTMKPGERAALIHACADAMAAHHEELAQLESLDTGKPINSARGEIFAAIGAIRYYAGWAAPAFTSGATCVPMRSMARSSCSCDRPALSIWNVNRSIPPRASLWRRSF